MIIAYSILQGETLLINFGRVGSDKDNSFIIFKSLANGLRFDIFDLI
jgi:hypothetical protein